MKQVIRKGLRDIIVDDVPDPRPGTGEVLVRPFYSLISSGTETADIHTDSLVKEVTDNPSHLSKLFDIMMKTDPVSTVREVVAKFSEYAVLGYSGAGVIVEIHDSVTEYQVGELVAYGGEGTGHSQTVRVGKNLVAPIPPGVTCREACFTTVGAIAMNAVRQANIQLGDNVVVIGLGLVGQLVSQLARCSGATVVGSDIIPERREFAAAEGTDHCVDAAGTPVDSVMNITKGRGADCVIVAVAAKTSAPLTDAVRMCRMGGRIVIVGVCPLELNRDLMYAKNLSLHVARAYGPGSYDPVYEVDGIDYPYEFVRWTENRNMREFLRLLSAGKVGVTSLVTHDFQLDNAAAAYQAILTSKSDCLAVLLQYPDQSVESALKNYAPRRRLAIGAGSSASDAPLTFGLLGAGNLAKWAHLPAIKANKHARLRAVCSSSGARGKSYGLRFEADYACTDYQAMLEDPEIDAIIIASASPGHADEAIRALNAGKHVFVEKPMATTLEECRSLLCAVRDSDRQLAVGFNRRFAPDYQFIKKRLGETGSAILVTSRMCSGLPADHWGGDPQYGGAVVGEGCHFADLMYWLCESEPVSVRAACLPIGEYSDEGTNNLSATIEFRNGSIGSFVYTTLGSSSSQGELVEVYSSGISMTAKDFKQLEITGSRPIRKSRRFADKGYQEQLDSFVTDILAGRPVAVSAIDGARATVLCRSMLESARTGTTVEIDLDSLTDDCR